MDFAGFRLELRVIERDESVKRFPDPYEPKGRHHHSDSGKQSTAPFPGGAVLSFQFISSA